MAMLPILIQAHLVSEDDFTFPPSFQIFRMLLCHLSQGVPWLLHLMSLLIK